MKISWKPVVAGCLVVPALSAAQTNLPPNARPGSPSLLPSTSLQQKGSSSATLNSTTTPSKAQSEIEKIFGELNDRAKAVDDLVKRLGDASKIKPEDTQKEVDTSANILAGLIDRLKPDGDFAQHVQALRNASTTHQKRVQDMKPEMMDEADKKQILDAWDQIIQNSDNARIAIDNMRSSLTTAYQKLQRKKTAISELFLAERTKAALDSFMTWINELKDTAESLHQFLNRNEPRT